MGHHQIVYQVKWVPSMSEYWTDIHIDKDNSLNPSGDSLEALHRSLLSCAHAAELKGFLFERGNVTNLE